MCLYVADSEWEVIETKEKRTYMYTTDFLALIFHEDIFLHNNHNAM